MRRFWWLPVLGLLVLLVAPTAANSPRQTAPSDDYGFRSFWESNGGERIFGAAVTGVIDEAGLKVQYFERARLEYHPDAEPQVLLGLLGRERTKWQQFAPPASSPASALRFDATPYTIAQPFRSFWEETDGLALFGLPISDSLWEHTAQGRFQVQYFERGQLIHHPLYAGTDEEFEIAPLGREIAAARGYVEGLSANQAPVMFAYDPVPPAPVVDETPVEEAAPVEVAAADDKPPARPSAPPPAKPAPAAPQPSQGSAKEIVVDLSDQWLYAYQNGEQVFAAPVATGKDGFNTPAGEFSIYAKVPLQTMRGSLNGETWVVPNVPHAMYFNGSVALHGTYWHNLFGSGTRISHGCVNLPLDAAAWIYDWARVGTSVTVRY
ncbi:MAG TPA: L,D-transpeptidase [Herpetosiphonaceae bacterium]